MHTRRHISVMVRFGGAVTVLLFVLIGIGLRHGTAEEPGTAGSSATARHFETNVAPLLARHCLECHDSETRDGGLDLSRKDAAFAGGDSGKAIVPGKSGESPLWEYVEIDVMPKNRAALSDEEKRLLRKWIDGGAVWSIETLDPDVYASTAPMPGGWLQRLTVPEYIETVRSAVGVDIDAEARRILPRDQRADGFSNTAYNLAVDLGHVEAYARLAAVIVSRMDISAFAAEHSSCNELTESCLRETIAGIGKWLLRGPLEDQEISSYLTLASAVQEEGGHFDEVVGYIVEAMLQSPRFLYRVERQIGDGTPHPADDYEIASRISYILWGAPPDRELMRAADAGELTDPQRLESHVQRMLEDPRAVDRSLQFIHDWIDLDRLATLRPNPERFPQWNAQLAADMQAEMRAFFEELVWKENRPLWDLLNAQFTYATPRLAHHYGLFAGSREQEDTESVPRVTKGMQVLYRFDEGGGKTVRDASGKGDPLDLTITDPSGVRWRPQGGLEIHSNTLISRERPPHRLIEALKKSKAITIEAWITPADTVQAGPARIVTLSNGISSRNVTLGQDGDRIDVRLRTSNTDGNGMPSLRSPGGSVAAAPMHVVYSRDASGTAIVYIDGQEAGREKVEGDFSNWDDRFLLAVGNELSKDRLWQGTLHLIGLYDRARSVEEVRQNHAAGGGTLEDDVASLAVQAAWEQADKSDLLALYRFDEGDGRTVRDRSGTETGLDLQIDNHDAARWGTGGLTVYESTLISGPNPPKKFIETVKRSKALTLEAWITPANLTQDGPARIVTLSSGTSQRNFTLGQEGNRYDVRIRAGKTDHNGMPGLAGRSGAVETALTHVVFTVESSGQARLFVNGEEQASTNVGGDFSSWNDGYQLALANETSKDRPWLGTYHLVAIYGRALSAEEIESRGAGMIRYDVADNPARGGLLTQGSVLTIGGDEASMVTRGLFVLHDLLYSRVGNPPACVDTTPVPTEPGMSMRAIAEARLADASCTGCHSKFEPLAFGLEKFDGIGAWHEQDEHGNQLREDGEILFPGRKEPVSYETSTELMDLLAGSDRVQMAITRKVTQFALGRPLTPADIPIVQKIHETASRNGGTYQALITEIIKSDLVRMTRTVSDAH